MGIRQDRLGENIKDLLAQFFLSGKINDPRLSEVTVTEVRLTGDLQIAKVYFRVYDKKTIPSAKKALAKASGLFRSYLAKNLDIRRVPELQFFFDETIEHASRIEELLHNLNKP